MNFPSSDTDSLIEFYGDPDVNGDGRPDVKWEIENLVKIKPPYPMVWAWNDIQVKTISLHKKCAPAFLKALEGIRDEFDPFDRKRYQLDRCGGGYNFRLMRGGNKLSLHSYGAALDLAPEINFLGRKYDAKLNMMPMAAVMIFQKQGLTWGGRWGRPDAQHFQACN